MYASRMKPEITKRDKWISVENYLPPYQKRVITVDIDNIIRVLVCDMFEGLPDWYDEEWEGFEESIEVTHWMELPEIPKGDK